MPFSWPMSLTSLACIIVRASQLALFHSCSNVHSSCPGMDDSSQTALLNKYIVDHITLPALNPSTAFVSVIKFRPPPSHDHMPYMLWPLPLAPALLYLNLILTGLNLTLLASFCFLNRLLTLLWMLFSSLTAWLAISIPLILSFNVISLTRHFHLFSLKSASYVMFSYTALCFDF